MLLPTYLPIYDTSGNLIGQMPWNIPNWPSYSNDINMAFNIGESISNHPMKAILQLTLYIKG